MTKNEAYALLVEIKSMAIEMSMTGQLYNGTPMLLRIYNSIVQEVIAQEWLDGSSLLNALLNPETNEEAGVGAAMLLALMKSNEKEREVPSTIQPDR